MQNRYLSHLRLTGILGLFVVTLCSLLYFFYPNTVHQYLIVSKTLRFNYTLSNASDEFIPRTDFSIKIPMNIDSKQSLISISSSHTNELIQENSGEQSIAFSIENISPYSSRVIDLTVVVDIGSQQKYERIEDSDFLAAEKYIELNSPKIKVLAAQLKGTSSEDTARNVYKWLVNNITPASYAAERKGAEYLVVKKRGDCTEFMYAFIALARANGVPARGISGFWVPSESTIINAADYHDWAEFHNGKRWVLVDGSKRVFDDSYLNYIKNSVLVANSIVSHRFILGNKSLTISQ